MNLPKPRPRTIAAALLAAVTLSACGTGAAGAFLPRAQQSSHQPGHHHHHHGHGHGQAATASPAAATSSPAATPAPSATCAPASGLTANEQAFVCAVRAALAKAGYRSPMTDATIATSGHLVCTLLSDGLTEQQIIVGGRMAGTYERFKMTPTQFVTTAHADMCPNS